MKALLIRAYKRALVRRRFFRLHQRLLLLSLWGLGILNSDHPRLSGEARFLEQVARKPGPLLVLDVGANRGAYANRVRLLRPDAMLYAFEPHPLTFGALQIQAEAHGYTAIPAACGAAEGRAQLYDYPEGGSTHASLYAEAIRDLRGSAASSWEVAVTTIDSFVQRGAIERIDLLKIDTEGHELDVLRGATQSLERGLVDLIQFEFNEMHVLSRVFLRDFQALLPRYAFLRMLPDGLVRLDMRHPFLHEIFAYQNIVAVRPGARPDLLL
jgi:FkbM family methyltransferase